jgi:hypothetical protein
MKKRFAYLFCALSLPVLLTSPVLAAPVQQMPISSHPGFHFNHRHYNALSGTTSLTSENWSGYAATDSNGSYKTVSSSWTQSALNCAATPKNAYSSYWVGLDGFNSSTVEQIGTEADCVNHNPVYASWYEMYPSNPYEVSLPLAVHPGDHLTASVNYQPSVTTTTIVRRQIRTTTTPASYVLSLSDSTTGRAYSVTLTPRQSYARSSAEVITEAPYSNGILPLADYGTVNYASSFVNGLPLGGLPNLQDIVMQNPSGMVSTPSVFDPTNENFGVTWSAS